MRKEKQIMITTIDVRANTRYVNINYDYKNLCTGKYTVNTNKVKSIKVNDKESSMYIQLWIVHR